MAFSRFNVNIFLTEVIFFVASFVVGIVSTLQINKILAGQTEIAKIVAKTPPGTVPVLPPELVNVQYLNTPEFITIDQFIISFFLATLFFLILTKTKYGPALFRFIFFIALFAGAQVIFQVWINQNASIIIAILFVLARYIFPRVAIHNFAIITAITGISINLGMNIETNEAILILITISVYDCLAVYVTGHMVKMLKDTISTGTIFAMIIPQNFSDMGRTVSEVGKEKATTIKEKSKSDYVYLGGGDLAFPLIMVVAALKVGLYSAIVTSIGALVGLLALNLIFAMQKGRKPMAALPPLAAFSILGFIASLIRF
jgi:presenilin-like A22 family membrane protease